ncbi:saccharopine dehydrogenase NADP-binding domain-containing protein [candidate division KSB1 bacterium]|nr:saccharopine dehydrogenase NADP-binding domain-containing protein [candidate division KSB1 bacterium]
MKILLLGVGMQGKAALHDLFISPAVSNIIAADKDLEMLQTHVSSNNFGQKVTSRYLDATNTVELNGLFEEKPDIVIDLLPVPFMETVAEIAVEKGCHSVNTFYTSPVILELAKKAAGKGLSILPEFGLDPGIDLVLLGEAKRHFDEINTIMSYGGGIPEKSAIDNPLKYKVTWTFEGVLRAYLRTGYIVNHGEILEIKKTEIFDPKHIHEIEIDELGKMEAYPNGDASKYIDLLDIDKGTLNLMGRYALRWPGHSAFWKSLVDLHLLDDEPVLVGGVAVDRKKFLASIIEPQIRLKEDERDIAVVRIEVEGKKNGRKKRCVYQVIDRRDLQTGLTAMSRTVGYTASIGAQLIGTGILSKKGLLSPVSDIPYNIFKEELERRNIHVTEELS